MRHACRRLHRGEIGRGEIGGNRRGRARRRPSAALVAALLAACVPSAGPLVGTVVPVRVPDTALPAIHQQITFDWTYEDRGLRITGDGAARIAPPDSVRLDFFVTNGVSGGHAWLFGDRLVLPQNDDAGRYLPPVPMLWGALGRLVVPASGDTTARVDGDTLRVEIGQGPRWRATFVGSALDRLERIDDDHVPERLERAPRRMSYVQYRAHRSLDLTVVRVDTVPGFDASIWR